MKQVVIDMAGRQIGNWIVLRRAPNGKRGTAYWWCLCACGKVYAIYGRYLRNGRSWQCASCGAVKRGPNRVKHNLTHHTLWNVWKGMNARCYNPNVLSYPNYGGRGIEICPEWLEDNLRFFQWARETGYKVGLSIERIDNNGPYSPQNCTWATQKEQARNTRQNVNVEFEGRVLCLSAWAEELGIARHVLACRYRKGERGARLLGPIS